MAKKKSTKKTPTKSKKQSVSRTAGSSSHNNINIKIETPQKRTTTKRRYPSKSPEQGKTMTVFSPTIINQTPNSTPESNYQKLAYNYLDKPPNQTATRQTVNEPSPIKSTQSIRTPINTPVRGTSLINEPSQFESPNEAISHPKQVKFNSNIVSSSNMLSGIDTSDDDDDNVYIRRHTSVIHTPEYEMSNNSTIPSNFPDLNLNQTRSTIQPLLENLNETRTTTGATEPLFESNKAISQPAKFEEGKISTEPIPMAIAKPINRKSPQKVSYKRPTQSSNLKATQSPSTLYDDNSTLEDINPIHIQSLKVPQLQKLYRKYLGGGAYKFSKAELIASLHDYKLDNKISYRENF